MLTSWDERRDLIVLKTHEEAISFAVEHWIHSSQRAIQQRGSFTVALSGGSTPKAIYEKLAQSNSIEWDKIYLFWSDERAVPPTDPESNYHMASLTGLTKKIPSSQIFRMKGENNIEKNSKEYDEQLRRHLTQHNLDLVMLGIGEDGHTASLFPDTAALDVSDQLVAANHVPQKNTWRMTFTYPAIHKASRIAIYALGSSKRSIIQKVLNAPILSPWPASRIGTPEHKALWILDQDVLYSPSS